MGNFSSDPGRELQQARERGYIGVRVEQGVPLLDRDLNLLADLVSSSVRDVLARHLGAGLADRSDAFRVDALAADAHPAANDFLVLSPPEGGACLVAGIEVAIDRELRYGAQPGAPALTTPGAHGREDVVYLDVWVDEVDQRADPRLGNAHDVGVATSVRLRPAWRVLVAEGRRQVPEPLPGHAHHPLAMLERPAGDAEIRPHMIVDLRRTGLNLADLARRVERLEAALARSAEEPLWRREAAGAPRLRAVAGGRERSP